MRIAIRRSERAPCSATHVLEVITPRTNTAALTSAENFFASMTLGQSFSVELAADSRWRRFLVRASSAQMRDQLVSQLGAAYPQADGRPVPLEDDPALVRAGEQFAACTLQLRAPAYLPLRTFTDLDVDGERAAQADPLLGILSSLGDLPPGWRGLSQLVLQRAPEDWCRDYQRKSVEHPLQSERTPYTTESAAPMFLFLAALLAVLVVSAQAYRLIRAELWLELAMLFGAGCVGLIGLLLLVRRLRRTALYDMELVREKVTRIACRAELRLVVYAPANAPPAALDGQLERLATVYRRFNLASANGLVPAHANPDPASLRRPLPWRGRRHLAVLTTLELAGLWHLLHAAADVALLERTTARRWLPLPTTVAEGCSIGTARHQAHVVPVALPPDVLRRHLLLVAKTRRGKSSLIQRLAVYAMQSEPRRAVLVVDPHRDLAESLLGLMPPERRDAVVYLDVADFDRPFGLNLLDRGLGWNRDRAVANALTVFQREWGDRFWGPRMEDAFRYALMTLFEANRAICHAQARAAGPSQTARHKDSSRHGPSDAVSRDQPVRPPRKAGGSVKARRSAANSAGSDDATGAHGKAPAPDNARARQYTLLEVPALLCDPVFRREILRSVEDPTIHAWWETYFDPMDRRFQLEVINPVLTKIHRFDANTPARNIVGQSQSTIDPSAWLRDGATVIVNTARGVVGENAAALVGSTLLNLVTLAVAEQASLHPAARCPISIFVDEFHTIPGADYEAILAELSKYGANLVLATQSLARLLAVGSEEGRGLRATVFANLDGLFAFNCSAEDAAYLVPELGGAVDEQDLVELAEHQCYVRLSSGGSRLPTFSVELDPPLTPDPEQRFVLAKQSAGRFGRPAEEVRAKREAMLAHVLELRTRQVTAQDAAHTEVPKPHSRNKHRPRKKKHARPEPADAALRVA